MARRLQLKISGEVQGVSFRWFSAQQARRLGLRGWVRNHGDGTVRALAEGEVDRLQEFLDWCYTGVSGARVSAITAEWGEATGEFRDFEIRR